MTVPITSEGDLLVDHMTTESMERTAYDCALIAEKLNRWGDALKAFTLPEWNELPDFGLYMDQVVALLSKYLDYLPVEEGSDKAITVSTVNNYVRLKVMPAPVKKKYNRVHLAYLMMICTLKQNLSIANVQRMIPMGLTEQEVRERYNAYALRHKAASLQFIDQVRQSAQPVLNRTAGTSDVDDLISTFAVQAGLSRLMVEKLLHLQGCRTESAPLLEEAAAVSD